MWARNCAAALVALAALAGCVRIPVSEQSLFLPRSSAGAPDFAGSAWTVEDFFFTSWDGTPLNAVYLKQKGALATVLFLGGNAFSLADSRGFAEIMMRHPVNLFMMDYRGYGRSGGTPTAAAFRADALAAYDALAARFGPNPRRIIVHGHSLGSFAATLVASQRPVAALVLQNPATDGRDTLRYLVPWILRPFVRFDADPALLADSNLERLRGVSVPTLVAGAGRDKVTSPRMARALYAASPARTRRLVIGSRAGHNDLYLDPGFQAAYAEIVAIVSARR